MKNEWRNLEIEIHNLIRVGNTASAVQILQKINTSQVPREYALELAALCRRAGVFSQALRLLRPIVLAGGSGLSPAASPAEIGEYSISLFKSGCLYEALQWLDSIQGKNVEEADLYRGYAHIMEWDYERALTPLRSYISTTQDSFPKLVAKVNLAAALINTDNLTEAESLIQNNIEEAEKFNNLRLKANSYELLSQIAFKYSDYTKASAYLDKAWSILSLDSSMDQLFLVKWRAILDAVRTSDLSRLNSAREVAKNRNHFETLRDLDFYELKLNFSMSTFARLYCGTPYSAYRKRLRKEFNISELNPVCFVGEAGAPILDIDSMVIGDKHFNPTPQIHNTFAAIWSDLYRPRSVGSVFEKIFEGEYFDINTSPNRVHRLIARLRSWLKTHDIPVRIEFEHGGFIGVLNAGIQLKVSVFEPGLIDNKKAALKWNKAEALLSGLSDFCAEDLAEKLKQNHSSATRLLKWATANNKVIKTGAGRGCRYSFPTSTFAEVSTSEADKPK